MADSLLNFPQNATAKWLWTELAPPMTPLWRRHSSLRTRSVRRKHRQGWLCH